MQPDTAFAAELAHYGPKAAAEQCPSLNESRDYCRRLARSHYENFTVASWLLPRHLRQHFYHVYAYCRWSDDLADETGDPAQSLELLAWWEDQLRQCYRGHARHPVFVALAETIREFQIPVDPFADLLVAFRQDQRVTRYETFEDLLGYCRNSANPVGRLVLYLGRCHDETRGRLSDHVCTGLQLANFWQDVAGDWDRGRVYLPQSSCRKFGYDEADFQRRECTPGFRRLLQSEADRAERFLRDGLPLAEMMPRGLRGDIWLFAQGGLKILEKIRRLNYDVWGTRPKVSKSDQLRLLAGCIVRNFFSPPRESSR
jgi:squalene synthase HpnC